MANEISNFGCFVHSLCSNLPYPPLFSQSNRPFSVQNIVDSLQSRGVKKAGTERALAALVSKGTVAKKEFGKVNVFILAQSQLQLPDPEEQKTVDNEIASLSGQAAELDDTLNGLRGKISELKTTLSVDEAREEIARLDEVIVGKEAKLAKLGDGSALLTKEEKMDVEIAYFKLLSAWKKRKKMVKSIADIIGENSGMKPSTFYDEVGVEVDEDVNVSMADFPDVQNPTAKARKPVGGQGRVKRIKAS